MPDVLEALAQLRPVGYVAFEEFDIRDVLVLRGGWEVQIENVDLGALAGKDFGGGKTDA